MNNEEPNMFKKAYLRKLNEDIGIETNDADMAEPEVTDAPPEPTGEGDEFAPTADEGVSESQGGAAFNDLRSYMDTLPQDGQVSNQQIIDLGKKYADYFREVKDTIKELQEKQLSNAFEDCLNVKFLPLSKALSNMIDELDAGVADKVHEKNLKAEKEEGVSVGADMGV